MEQLKRTQVHMLPTDSKVITGQLFKWRKDSGGIEQFGEIGIYDTLGAGQYNFKPNTSNTIPQHLYFTIDEKIKVNQWCLNDSTGVVFTAEESELIIYNSRSHISKIIATTDPKLTLEDNHIDYAMYPKEEYKHKRGLPQPSQDFIKAYCEQGGIDEVDVEYECPQCQEWGYVTDCRELCNHKFIQLKVDPIHNTITTHLIEEKMYSASEVVKMFWDCHNGVLDEFQLKWIKENL